MPSMMFAKSLVKGDRVEFKVSEEDLPLISQYSWHLTSTGYLASRCKKDAPVGKPKQLIYMHRLIMMPPKELEVDHINRDKLDNRRENLRFATRSTNCLNIGIQKNNTSGVTGVSFCKTRQKWRVQYGKLKKAGITTKQEAIELRNKFMADISNRGGTCGS